MPVTVMADKLSEQERLIETTTDRVLTEDLRIYFLRPRDAVIILMLITASDVTALAIETVSTLI